MPPSLLTISMNAFSASSCCWPNVADGPLKGRLPPNLIDLSVTPGPFSHDPPDEPLDDWTDPLSSALHAAKAISAATATHQIHSFPPLMTASPRVRVYVHDNHHLDACRVCGPTSSPVRELLPRRIALRKIGRAGRAR